MAEVAATVTQGISPSARDVDVDLGGGRRLRGTVTDLYAERLVKVSYSRLGPKHWIDAWVPLLALCAAYPGRGWSAGSIGRGSFRRATDRVAFASADDCQELLADLVRLHDAGMRAPLPLPLKTGEAWARHARNPRVARGKAEKEWAKDTFSPENADPWHVRVWGPDLPLGDLLAATPLPGEERDDQRSRLGALACTLWQPMIDRGR